MATALQRLLTLICALSPTLAVTAVALDRVVTVATPILPSIVFSPYQGLSMPSTFSTLAVFDPLAVIDGQGRVLPWLAKSWQSEDGKVWRIVLEPDVVFSNGRPVDADALVASVAHMQSKAGRAETVGSSMALIDTIHAVSDREVEIVLKDRDAMFATRLALWKIPEPEGWTRASIESAAADARGSGPFMFEQIAANRLVLAANPQARHPASIDKLEFVMLPDQTARLQALLSGSADIALQLGIENRDPIESAGGAFVVRRTTMLRYIAFAAEHVKTKGSPILDARVRQALNHAVDKQEIIDRLLGGSVAEVGQLVFPGAPGFDPSLAPYPHDPELARRLLADAGYARGFDLTIRFAGTGNDDATVVQQIIADLKHVGVNVTVKPATQVQMTPLLFSGQLEAELFFNFARGLDALGDYRIRSCLGLTAGKPFFCDPDMLADVNRARAASTFDDAAAALRTAIRREHDNPPGIFLWETPAYDGFSARVPAPEGYGRDYDFVAAELLKLR